MVELKVILEGGGAWRDLLDKKEVIHLANDAPPITVAALHHGMKSGRPSVGIRIDLPGNRVVLAETSLRLFIAAADMLKEKYKGQF